MTSITLRGNSIQTSGKLPKLEAKAPEFKLTANDLSTKSLSDYRGQNIVLNIFPSIDTGTCAQSVRKFNEKASQLNNTKVLCISKDLPFAQARFCGAEGLNNVETLSDYKTGRFGKDYGLEMTTGPLETLHSRCVVIINSEGNIIYTEQVPEIADEPNYNAVLKALS